MKSPASLKFWSADRHPRSTKPVTSVAKPSKNSQGGSTGEPDSPGATDHRTVYQHDYDRLLFSTPVRRLADKTQVWPMDVNDGVRTRLTHSHEVANLARSIGTRAYLAAPMVFNAPDTREGALGGVIQPMLSAIGLGHDLGNPPFGHQGEAAMGNWFKLRQDWIFSKTEKGGKNLPAKDLIPAKYRTEFTSFDGNPQSLRLLTKLQTHIGGVGLDLSAATLAASLKYSVAFHNVSDKKASTKKGGYFESERHVVDWIRATTGLSEGKRHPLTWIMEACDDIAYSVLDVDDVLKKGIMSADDVLVNLRRDTSNAEIVGSLGATFRNVEATTHSIDMQREIKIQYLRAKLLDCLIGHASSEFVKHARAIFSLQHSAALMDNSMLCERLKEVARSNAFNHSDVLKAEAIGAAAIDGLMTVIWESIVDRKVPSDIKSRRRGARSKYVFSLISPNYVQQAHTLSEGVAGGIRYRELRLLTDMVSGMTDTFAMRLWNEVKAIPNVDRT